jgi:AraC family L-rhamnose operon transcriptional activator RhaR
MHLNEILQKYSSRNGLPPTPEMLAAEAGMSRSSFYRYFSRITGKSIHNYFLEQRILNAKIDLLHTTDAIKNIAERHGFTSVHHFTKVFTRTAGISPGTFRREFADRDS